jgi:hypothetical protein
VNCCGGSHSRQYAGERRASNSGKTRPEGLGLKLLGYGCTAESFPGINAISRPIAGGSAYFMRRSFCCHRRQRE